MAESEMSDNQKIQDNNSTINNYVIAIITAIIYVLAGSSGEALSDMMFFIPTVIGTLGIPAIFAGIYYLFKRKGFSKVFAWVTVIMCVMSYLGNSSKSDSSLGYETTNDTDFELNKVSTKEYKKTSTVHPTKKPYDSTANIFEEERYSKERTLRIVKELGPLVFRKEDSNWYLYKFDDEVFYTGTRFKLYRVPVDQIYNRSFESTEERVETQMKFFDSENQYHISYINHLQSVLTAKCSWNWKTDKCENYTLSNEIEITDFGFNVKFGNVRGSALAYNTTNYNIKNIKIKISVYTEMFDGELITEDIYIINDSLKSGELKVININYSPKKSFEAKGITPMNLKILEYDKF